MIKVNPDRADLVETRVIDGRQCLVIAVDDHIEVNGINVRTIKKPGSIENIGNAEPMDHIGNAGSMEAES